MEMGRQAVRVVVQEGRAVLLPRRCPRCGAESERDARLCLRCGGVIPLTARSRRSYHRRSFASRRLAVALVAVYFFGVAWQAERGPSDLEPSSAEGAATAKLATRGTAVRIPQRRPVVAAPARNRHPAPHKVGERLKLTAYDRAVLADHPIGYWRFGDVRHRVVPDLSGHGRTASLMGAFKLVRGVAATADSGISLEGHGFVDAGSGYRFMGSGSFSLEIWARWRAGGTFPRLFSLEPSVDQSRNSESVLLGIDEMAQSLFFARPLAHATTVYAGVDSASSSYSYIVATYDGSTMSLYLDGTLQGSVRNKQPLPDVESELLLGRGANWYYRGELANAAVYDRALTPAEIGAHLRAAR
jgi:hypothetical protein